MSSILRKLWATRCVCCRATVEQAFCVVLTEEQRLANRADVVVTCGAHYCIDRAERGDFQLEQPRVPARTNIA